MVPISPKAADVLANIPRVEDNPWVIPEKLKGRHMRNLNNQWELIRGHTTVGDMRLHDCQHLSASSALVLSEALPIIGRLPGHTQVETTARYAHLDRHLAHGSAVLMSDNIAGDILSGKRPT